MPDITLIFEASSTFQPYLLVKKSDLPDPINKLANFRQKSSAAILCKKSLHNLSSFRSHIITLNEHKAQSASTWPHMLPVYIFTAFPKKLFCVVMSWKQDFYSLLYR
jgi:hypothetical protein